MLWNFKMSRNFCMKRPGSIAGQTRYYPASDPASLLTSLSMVLLWKIAKHTEPISVAA